MSTYTRLFLRGLEEEGKGEWKAISKKYLHTRTPAQIASHAQKFMKRKNSKTPPEKRRASINDITTYSDPIFSLDSQQPNQPGFLMDSQNFQPDSFTIPYNFQENFPSNQLNYSLDFENSQPNQFNFPLDSHNMDTSPSGNATNYNDVYNNY